MTLKRPIILKALSRPETIFGMHSVASLANLIVTISFGFFTEVIFGVVLFCVLQIFIAVLTRRDRYFGEVFLSRLRVGRTKNLNCQRRGNFYGV